MKLTDSGNFYKSLFDGANDGILGADLTTKKFHIANKAICEMLGYSQKEIKNLGVADIHPKEDLPHVMEEFERQSKGEIGENILASDLPVRRKDGSVFYANVSASRMWLGGKVYLVGIFRDVTERRRIEKDLENAKVAARNVLEDLQLEKETLGRAKVKDEAMLASIGDGMVAADERGRIVTMSKAAEKMLGWRIDEVEGKSFYDVVLLIDEKGKIVQKEKRFMYIAQTTGQTTTTTTTTTTNFYKRKDGTSFPVVITATPILLEGKVAGAINVFRDITKEKEIEKLRADFLSLASHQLRTPLSGTKWLIDTMRGEVLGSVSQKQKEYLDYLYQINERMIKLVSEMLNVLILESGVAVIKKQKVPVSKVYEELLLMMEPASREKGVTLRNALKNHKFLFLETDLQILRSILECFVSNAINYSQSGQEVVLDVKEESDAVVFSVKDSGAGIPKEEQKRVFERFYRASNAKKIRPDGTGLGLYTASILAEKMGAKMSFESEANKGSTFYLRVPKTPRDSTKTQNI